MENLEKAHRVKTFLGIFNEPGLADALMGLLDSEDKLQTCLVRVLDSGSSGCNASLFEFKMLQQVNTALPLHGALWWPQPGL